MRPTYPEALFDRLADYGALGPRARVLEIAPGTGQATVSLVARGWSVTAVERGARLAALARQALASTDAEVVVSAFEDWAAPPEPFDAVICATAFHWLDPATRTARIAAALRPGGAVAVIWTHHVAGGSSDFFERAQACHRRFDPTADDEALPEEGDLEPFTAEFEAAPGFGDVQDHRFPVEISYSAEGYTELLRTYSSVIALAPDAREGLLACLHDLIEAAGGRIVKRYVFELVLARRR